jgi:hypothetical protein
MKYQSLRITLTTEERNELEKIVSNGTAQAKEIRRANILLSVDESEGRKRMKDVVVARILGTTPQTICQVKKDYLQKTQVADSIKRKKRETPPVPARSTAASRPTSSPSPAQIRLPDMGDGRSGSLPTGWWNWIILTQFPIRQWEKH